ncbi:MAG: nitrous oxide reductase accessory protein NosL [Flavobacteriaceae bacterium]|nr:nitrous oxide reductase accessory protein NosL [Flavobacteriaceae bacterium]
MKKGLLAIVSSICLLFTSCKVEPEKILYGSDACHFCKMTIVDQQHAAQYVTTKGKQFKFDAIECMLNDMSEKNTNNISVYLVSDYGNPGSMTDAQTATYLISQKIKSPMGAFLSAFSVEALAKKTQEENEGELYTWTTIKEKYDLR